jgi:hypothetical protein
MLVFSPPIVVSPRCIDPMGGDVAISTHSTLRVNAHSGGGRVLGHRHSPPVHCASRGSQRCWWCHPHLPRSSSSPLPLSLDRLHLWSTLRAVACRCGGRCWVVYRCHGALVRVFVRCWGSGCCCCFGIGTLPVGQYTPAFPPMSSCS